MAASIAAEIHIQGYVYGLAAHHRAGGEICFAAHTQGLSSSADGGATWQPAFAALAFTEAIPATSVVLSPTFATDQMVLAGVPGGILVSRDGGVHWNSSILPDPPPFITTLAISPNFAHDGYAFAGTLEDGVFVTHTHGSSWTAWNIGLLDHTILCLAISPAFAHDRTLFAGTESGIYRTTNAGRYWQSLEFMPADAAILSMALSPSYAQDQILLVGTASDGLFSTLNATHARQILPAGEEQSAVNAVLISPEYSTKPHILALLDDTVLLSRDAGSTWAICADAANYSDSAISSLAAPAGLDQGCPLILGFIDGRVERTVIDIV